MRLCKVLKIVSVFHPITTLPSSLFISLPSKWTPGRQSERQCRGVGVEHPSGLGAEASCARVRLFNTPPRLRAQAQTGNEVFVSRSREGLREEICCVLFRGAVVDHYLTRGNAFADEMVVDVDVLRACMWNFAIGGSNGALAISVQNCGLGLFDAELG